MIKQILGGLGVLTGGIGILALGFLLLAVKIAVVGFVIYFFAAMGGLVPPVDYIPFVPFV